MAVTTRDDTIQLDMSNARVIQEMMQDGRVDIMIQMENETTRNQGNCDCDGAGLGTKPGGKLLLGRTIKLVVISALYVCV
jgi:hypothetical protein